MNRRSFLRGLMALGAGIAVVGPSVLADVHRYVPIPESTNFYGKSAAEEMVEAQLTIRRYYRRIRIDNFVLGGT